MLQCHDNEATSKQHLFSRRFTWNVKFYCQSYNVVCYKTAYCLKGLTISNKMGHFSFHPSQNFFYFMWIISTGDKLHEISSQLFKETDFINLTLSVPNFRLHLSSALFFFFLFFFFKSNLQLERSLSTESQTAQILMRRLIMKELKILSRSSLCHCMYTTQLYHT